ncbi:MAG: DUF1868 domain-containing protein [Planctomycetota bacterium]
MSLAEAAAAEGPPRWLDKRFDAEARALPDPGCTVVAHVTDSAQVAALAEARAVLEGSAAAPIWAFTPPASWHMTLVDLYLHSRDGPEWRPAGMPQELFGRQADAWILERLRGFDPGETPPFRVRVLGVYAAADGLGLALEGESAAEEWRLRRLRFRIARQAGLLLRPGHESYRFHLTLGYLIRKPDAALVAAGDAAVAGASQQLRARLPVLELGAPEVCLFDDMTAFRPEFLLDGT